MDRGLREQSFACTASDRLICLRSRDVSSTASKTLQTSVIAFSVYFRSKAPLLIPRPQELYTAWAWRLHSSCLPLNLRCNCSGFPCGTIYWKATAIANTILSLYICNSHCYASHQSLVSTSNSAIRSFIINIMQSSFSLFFVFGSCSCCWFDLQRYLCHYTIFSFLLPDLISFKKYLCSWNCYILQKSFGAMVSSPDQTPQAPFMFFLIIHYFERPASSVRLVKSIHLRAMLQYWLIRKL